MNIKQFIASPFARDTVTLQAGSVGAMAVQAVAGIVLARLLGPEQFGEYALAFSVAMVASVLLGAGAYDAMIPHISRAWHTRKGVGMRDEGVEGRDEGVGNQEEPTTEIRGMLAFLVKFVLIAGAIALVVGLLLPFITGAAYGSRAIGWYAFAILAAAALSTTFFESAKLAAQVTGRIKTLSLLTFGDHFSRFGWAVVLVVLGLGIAGATLGHLFGALMLAVAAGVAIHTVVRADVSWPSVRTVLSAVPRASLRPYVADTLWVLGDRNLAMLFGALPVALAGLFVAAEQVAYFKVAFGYLTLALAVLGPISVLLNTRFPMIQVTEPRLLKRAFVRVSWYAAGVSMLVTVAVIAVAPLVFPILYGSQYDAAIPLAQAFLVHGMFFGFGVGLGPMWRALSKVRVSMLINVLTLGIGIPLGLVMMHTWGVWGAVAMVTLWYLVSHMISFWYIVRLLGSTK